MTDRKKALLIKSTFRGIGRIIDWVNQSRDYRNYNILELKYFGDIETSGRMWRESEPYLAKDFALGPNRLEKSSVTSIRFSDVINYLNYQDYSFRKRDGKIELVTEKEFENKSAVEKIVQLIVDKIDLVLPIWNADMGGAGFAISMEERNDFLQRLKNQLKPQLEVESRPIQDLCPRVLLEKYDISTHKGRYFR